MAQWQRVVISIITPCLNSARYIGAAIESVLAQGIEGVEHIVVDGGSTDGTLAALARYPHLKVIGGPDRGIYDGLNKGLAQASRAIVGFLAADDLYEQGALSHVAQPFEDAAVMAVAGRASSFRESLGNGSVRVEHFPPAAENLLFHCTLGNPTINAWFFRTRVFETLGNFDSAYRVAGDREFMLRLACSGLRYAAVPDLVYRYRAHADSTTFAGNETVWHTVMHEHAAMTAKYLRRADLPTAARTLIRQARTRDTLRAAGYAWRRRQWNQLAFYAATGVRHDALWPLRLLGRAARSGRS
jgi:glycosyltransferase involved in cell wall biosynthesis